MTKKAKPCVFIADIIFETEQRSFLCHRKLNPFLDKH